MDDALTDECSDGMTRRLDSWHFRQMGVRTV